MNAKLFKLLCLTLIFNTNFAYSQMKLFREFSSGMDIDSVENIIKTFSFSSATRGVPCCDGVYESLIFTQRVNFNFMFNDKGILYGISLWTKNEFDESEYEANIKYIVNEFTKAVSSKYGNPHEIKAIPKCETIPINSSIKVKWWIKLKKKNGQVITDYDIAIEVEKWRRDDQIRYFVRLNVLDGDFMTPIKEDVNKKYF